MQDEIFLQAKYSGYIAGIVGYVVVWYYTHVYQHTITDTLAVTCTSE